MMRGNGQRETCATSVWGLYFCTTQVSSPYQYMTFQRYTPVFRRTHTQWLS